MAKYYIKKDSELGQDIIDIMAQARLLIENDEGTLTKTELVERINDIIRAGKRVRNKLTICDQYELSNYRVE